ncbi:MAG: beta-carotene hydroxylase, partial [Synechococcaceae bacterium WB9_2_112]|nr:beta-carotene hydroxylase [Synechococcaceae bacterium WB9_2_112]
MARQVPLAAGQDALPRSVPKDFLDPPAAWNPTVGLFLGGYALAGLTIWGWF